jgi:hypothetical protein
MMVASKSDEYVALAGLIETLLEIALILEENYRLEQELFQAKRGLGLLQDEIQPQMNLTENLGFGIVQDKVDSDILAERIRANEARVGDKLTSGYGNSSALTKDEMETEIETQRTPSEINYPESGTQDQKGVIV